jgi:GTP diphosphokinase / guanosine-3',5'-bis(diphosphate) 3'-diphosphatase
MTRKEFFQRIHKYVDYNRNDEIIYAYQLGKLVHRGQLRDDKTDYFEHCKSVALILTEFAPTNADEIIVGLLHDTTEDQYITDQMIRVPFGEEIANRVALLSKFTATIDRFGEIVKVKKDLDEYFHGLLSGDIKVKRPKLADRLHNLRSMFVWNEDRRRIYAEETEKHILPLADSPETLSLRKAIELELNKYGVYSQSPTKSD